MLPIVKLLKVLGPEYTGMSKQIAKLEAIIYKKSVDGVRLWRKAKAADFHIS